MRQLRQVSPSVFFFLALLLHCSQTCLAAGHTHAAVTIPASAHHGPEHAPCHSAPAPRHGTPDKCPDCADHVFLKSVSSGAEALTAAGPCLLPLCLLIQPVLPVLSHPRASVLQLTSAALSPPRYLAFSVLRL